MGCGGSSASGQDSSARLKSRGAAAGKGDTGKKKVHEAKIVLVGAMAVGKSSIALRYYHNKFPDAH